MLVREGDSKITNAEKSNDLIETRQRVRRIVPQCNGNQLNMRMSER